jgi:hypothetical protein
MQGKTAIGMRRIWSYSISAVNEWLTSKALDICAILYT